MDEQRYWAKQLQALGLSGKPLPAKKITAITLAAGIRSVLDSGAMTEKAQQARMMMQPDRGVAKALQLIATLLGT